MTGRGDEPAVWESSLPESAITGDLNALPLSALRVPAKAIKHSPTEEDSKDWEFIKDVNYDFRTC
jgi:hypothetical protein